MWGLQAPDGQAPYGQIGRSPTFLVGAAKQRGILDEFQKRDEHYSTEYSKNKPLCFNAEAYQKTHPAKKAMGYADADATLTMPMLLGICDGVSQMEDYGIDASELPAELLEACRDLALVQLMPDGYNVAPSQNYRGPMSLLSEAYEATECLGSTTVLISALDNSTKIHGKVHPMIAVLSIGDCELLVLRRIQGRDSNLEGVFHTEMQRIDGHVQTPLQLARVDDRIDKDFDEEIAMEVINKGSAVHCVSAYEGDVVLLGTDGVFDNLFLEEIVDICNEYIRPSGAFIPTSSSNLKKTAMAIVAKAHSKCPVNKNTGAPLPDAPIGKGGKSDDTSVIVAEIVEWTSEHAEVWAVDNGGTNTWDHLICNGTHCETCGEDPEDIEVVEVDGPRRKRTRGARMDDDQHSYEYSEEDADEEHCVIL